MHEAVGRTQTQTEVLDPVRAAAMHAILGIAGDPPRRGQPLPPFWHQAYFWNIKSAAELGPDGHPALGGFIPDLGLPNRMWAGGRLRFIAPLLTGRKSEKTTTIERVEHKAGRSGLLGFVTLRHEITQGSRLCVTEWQDLVYRSRTPLRGARVVKAPTDADMALSVRFPESMLFRYSAITFNAHRIHYDAEFCRKDFGQPAPVVQGPLLAQSLILLAQEQLGQVRQFEFRATAPLLVGQSAELCWRSDGTLWVRGPRGRLVMQASAH